MPVYKNGYDGWGQEESIIASIILLPPFLYQLHNYLIKEIFFKVMCIVLVHGYGQ